MAKVKVGLCKGRHEIQEVSVYIFGTIENPMDFKAMQETAMSFLIDNNVDELKLYVTGLTPALTSVLHACAYRHVPVTLMHFDRDSGQYMPQVMWHDYDLLREGGYIR